MKTLRTGTFVPATALGKVKPPLLTSAASTCKTLAVSTSRLSHPGHEQGRTLPAGPTAQGPKPQLPLTPGLSDTLLSYRVQFGHRWENRVYNNNNISDL